MSGGGGSGGQTVTQQSTAPPEVFQNALANTLGQAQSASQTPYENYPGQLQADFSPQQQQAFGLIGSTPGISAPYINAAAQHLDAATTPLWSGLPQYSQGAVDQYLNPYVNDVVHSTQAQFANTNAQAANQLQGNAASRGALGGDRAGVAQAVLRGQQELSQAPVIANLYNQGFQGAQQEFNQQQGAQLGADQANAWLNMQAGQGLSGLGNQALGSTLTSANALLGTGALQQQQAQQALNIPFSEWQAQRAYPYQNLSWLSGITQGLGATAGGTGTSTSTSPAPSAISQIAGLGTGIAGLAGAGNQLGWWGSGSGGGGGSGNVYDGGADVTQGARRGGAIHGFASGGDVPGLGEIDVPMGDNPDVGLSIFPAITSAGGGGAGGHGQTTSEGGGPSGAQQAQSAIGTIASLAGIAAAIFAKRGGRVPHRAPGGHVPMMPDYAGDPAQPIWVNSAPSTQTGFQLPVMHANPSPTAGLGSGGLQSLADYLAGQKAGAWTPPMGPQGPAAVPAPAVPAVATPVDPNGPLGVMAFASPTGNSNESGGGSTGSDPGGGPSGDAGGGMEGGGEGEGGGGGGGGGGDARGGAIHRGFAAGGDTGDEDYPAGFGLPTPLWKPGDAPTTDDPSVTGSTPLLQPAWRFLKRAVANPTTGFPTRADATDTGSHAPLDLYSTDPPADTGMGNPPVDRHDDAPLTLGNPPVDRHDDAVVTPTPTPTQSGGYRGATPPAGTDRNGTASADTTPATANFATTAEPVRAGLGMTEAEREAKADKLRTDDRALNAWLALAEAGFGMAAGRSPHALENIGGGALLGVKSFASAEQAAKKLAESVEANRARLAETSLYHQNTNATQNRRIDATSAVNTARLALLQYKANNPHMTSADVFAHAADDLTNQVNPETGQNYTPSEAFRYLHLADIKQQDADTRTGSANTRARQGDARIAQAQQRLLNTEAARAIQQQLTAQKMSDANIRTVMTNASRRAAADFTGKLTLERAVQEELRNWPGGAPSPTGTVPAAPAAPANPAAAIAEGATVVQNGKSYVKQNGQFVEVTP